jgi:hypothetical protein
MYQDYCSLATTCVGGPYVEADPFTGTRLYFRLTDTQWIASLLISVGREFRMVTVMVPLSGPLPNAYHNAVDGDGMAGEFRGFFFRSPAFANIMEWLHCLLSSLTQRDTEGSVIASLPDSLTALQNKVGDSFYESFEDSMASDEVWDQRWPHMRSYFNSPFEAMVDLQIFLKFSYQWQDEQLVGFL